MTNKENMAINIAIAITERKVLLNQAYDALNSILCKGMIYNIDIHLFEFLDDARNTIDVIRNKSDYYSIVEFIEKS